VEPTTTIRPVSLYVVTNKVNGKQYVGYTQRSPSVRWSQHRTHAKNGSTLRFHRALRKYGAEAFEWQVVAQAATSKLAAEAERALIVQYRPEYNMTEGGDGGGPRSTETCLKISAALKGKSKSAEHVAALRKPKSAEGRANISAAHLGLKQSAETRAKRSAALKGNQNAAGCKHSEETRRKIALGNTGKTVSAETREKMSRARRLNDATKRGELQLWL